jgi:hypothetical protein
VSLLERGGGSRFEGRMLMGLEGLTGGLNSKLCWPGGGDITELYVHSLL